MSSDWLIARDKNIVKEHVLPFLLSPVRTGGNPAAFPNALSDWGFLRNDSDVPSGIGQLLVSGQITWAEAVLMVLSKRCADMQTGGIIKPFVLICLILSKMKRLGLEPKITEQNCIALFTINDYSQITDTFVQTTMVAGRGGDGRYLDIWFNALAEINLFMKPVGGVLRPLPQSYVFDFFEFVAFNYNRLTVTPSKDLDTQAYYNYMGNTTSGIVEMLRREETYTWGKAICPNLLSFMSRIAYGSISVPTSYDHYLAAIKTKPFLLLAGLSGTGKSRLVRELARAMDTIDGENAYKVQKPENFEMIQVRPNWHDSTELMGYVSRVSGSPHYVMKDFVKFIAKAWNNKQVPFFLCLDEMNLAPVEQYFAEYLSVIESRKFDSVKGEITTDVLIKLDDEVIDEALDSLYSKDSEKEEIRNLKGQFKRDGGMRIPPNLVVMGTVNMDETTFSFSRKVLDRAMSFELNEVNLHAFLEGNPNKGLKIEAERVIGSQAEAEDVYLGNKDVCDKVVAYLEAVNKRLDGTPFKIAYRTRNEAMIYAVYRTIKGVSLETALDEITHMKILSRIEGDKQKLGSLLEDLSRLIQDELKLAESKSVKKLEEMVEALAKSEYVDFWG